MNILLHPTYFPSIAHFIAMEKSREITFEICDNYQKQTYRNRTYIYGANGLLKLSIPVLFSQNNRQLYRDIKIATTGNWQTLHWKSLLSAYSTSPFFEFYKDDFAPLFEIKTNYLLDYNLKCLEVVCDALQLDITYTKTNLYEKEPQQFMDVRHLVNARKKQVYNFEAYTQVFQVKHGFLSNLSILDLLFNEGTNALNYLENQSL